MKKITNKIQFLLLRTFLCVLIPVSTFSQGDGPSSSTSPVMKSFAMQADLIGNPGNSVNLFTGDVNLPVTLLSLPGIGGLNVDVNISYSSNVQHVVNTRNLDAPAGILGLGWSLEYSRIICDHKSTGATDDDTYYLIEGGSSNELIRTTSGSDAAGSYDLYEAKRFVFWKIKYYRNYQEWIILKEDGTLFSFGDNTKTSNTIQYMVTWGNWVGNSSQTSDQTQMPIAWNLSQIVNKWNERIVFEYEVQEQSVGSLSGQKQTEACYLKKITDAVGKQIQFNYLTKGSNFYAEPHTEKAEPDAYQEFYEKKYLDHIDVVDAGAIFTTIEFVYGTLNSGSLSKQLLTSIVQRNKQGQALPALKFSYYSTGPTAGFLQTVTSPLGGTTTYNYSEVSLNRSDRQFTVQAPAGYGQGKMWLGDDYVVVAWRELDAATNTGPHTVKVYAYRWMGEWKGNFIGSFSGVSLTTDANQLEYKKFYVVAERDFFLVMADPDNTTTCTVRLAHKREGEIETPFAVNTYTIEVGNSDPTIITGENFAAVGTYRDDSATPSKQWVFAGDTWVQSTWDQTIGDHFYTGRNNFIISHNKSVPEFNFHYLTEDKKWMTKSFPTAIQYGSDNRSYWYAADNFAVVMASQNPEFIYRWDKSYNLFRDSKDVTNADLFGAIADEAQVSIVANSLVGASVLNGYTTVVRFDGKYWYKTLVDPAYPIPAHHYSAYGNDVVVYPVDPGFPDPNNSAPAYTKYNGTRREFNPNTLAWKSDVTMGSTSAPEERARWAVAGNNFYNFGTYYYWRETNGAWTKSNVSITEGYYHSTSTSGLPAFSLKQGIRIFKNGQLLSPLQYPTGFSSPQALDSWFCSPNSAIGYETMGLVGGFAATGGDYSTEIKLVRLVNDEISGFVKDYPVTLITTNDGVKNSYISFVYNTATATSDMTSKFGYYNEVQVVPGTNTPQSSKPNGYTKVFFYNGLPSLQNAAGNDLRWVGQTYRKEVYNALNAMVASEQVNHQTFERNVLNDAGTKVDVAAYVRPIQVTALQDGLTTVKKVTYSRSHGLPSLEQVFDFDSKNAAAPVSQSNTVNTYYRYYFEHYDPTKSLNILAPVIQVKQSVTINGTETVNSVAATTWRAPSGIWAPYKSYVWKRTGSSDFDFATWSNTGEPSSGWTKVNQIDLYDTYGNVVQVSKP